MQSILCFPIDFMRFGLLGLSWKGSQCAICIAFSNRFDALWAFGVISERVPRCNLYCVFPMDLMCFGLLGLSPKESRGAIYIVFSNGFGVLWAVGIISKRVPRCNLYGVFQSI